MRVAGIIFGLSLIVAAPAFAQDNCGGQPLPPLPQEWLNTAVALTTYAETGRAGDYAAVADNSDGQGMSVGLLQWNFGQGTIAKIVNGTPNADAVALETMPTYGAAFVSHARKSASAGSPRTAAVKWAAETQATDRSKLHSEVKKFLAAPSVTKSQDAAAFEEGNEAWKRARAWMWGVRDGCRPHFAQFAVFFDYLNHGGKGNSTEITDVVAAYGAARGSNVNSDTRRRYSQYIALGEATWVMGYPHFRPCKTPTGTRQQDTGVKRAHGWDAQYNCEVWTKAIESNDGWQLWKNEIFFLAALGAKFRPGAREIFLNRKGTLALGRGVINGSLCDFTDLYNDRERNQKKTLDEIGDKVEASCKSAQPAPQ